jgi:hypothetical protein
MQDFVATMQAAWFCFQSLREGGDCLPTRSAPTPSKHSNTAHIADQGSSSASALAIRFNLIIITYEVFQCFKLDNATKM